jgi:integrase
MAALGHVQRSAFSTVTVVRPEPLWKRTLYVMLVSPSNLETDHAGQPKHSLRRTKATLIYRRRGNLRAVQLLLGHTKIESTVRYLGIEIDDAIEIAEKIDV